uniref:Transcription factor Elf N-terminal domain-containing protein n=1 Tax=Cercocebus atys TaxID=9531 RepID=A0A2K5NWS0_CERAT
MATSLCLDLLISGVEASVHSSNVHATEKTIEAAEALLHMESPTCWRDSRKFIHAAMRPDVITETVVEVSPEESEPMDTSPIPTSPESCEPMKKKKVGRKPKTQQSPIYFKIKILVPGILNGLREKKACSSWWIQNLSLNTTTKGEFLQRLQDRGFVYQFKDMPQNVVVIDDNKSETCNEDLAGNVSLSAESLLRAASSVRGGRNSSPRNCSRAEKGEARFVNIISPGHDAPSRSPTITASVSATAAPRTVCVATQVPVKISAVAVQSLNAGAPLIISTSPTTATSPKAAIQAVPAVMPASAENGDKITMQPAKIITIPATQLAQCQLKTKSNLIGSGGIHTTGAPLAVRAVTPVSIAHGTPVMRLSVPTQQASGQTPPQVTSVVIKGPEVKSEAVAYKQECDVETLPLVEEKLADGNKTVTHVVVVSAPSATALPVTMKTEGLVTCEK